MSLEEEVRKYRFLITLSEEDRLSDGKYLIPKLAYIPNEYWGKVVNDRMIEFIYFKQKNELRR